MKKVKITVMECTFNNELADKYATEGLTACTYNTPGKCFIQTVGKSPLDCVTMLENQ